VAAAWLYVGPAAIIYLPLFTLGLVGGGLLAIALWILYLGLTVLGLRARTRLAYLVLYVVFSVLLTVNASGCRRILEDLSQVK
jgi:hypothetical protein